MLFVYRGWHFDGSSRESAPNFGGREYWWKVKYRKGVRTRIGTGSDLDSATEAAYRSVDYAEDHHLAILRESADVEGLPF